MKRKLINIGIISIFFFICFSVFSVAETIKFDKSVESTSNGTTFEITVKNGNDVVGGATVFVKYRNLYCCKWIIVEQSYTDLEDGKCTVTAENYYGVFKVVVEDDELGTISSEELQGSNHFIVDLDYDNDGGYKQFVCHKFGNFIEKLFNRFLIFQILLKI
jgi:hypothetical protein